MGKYRKSYVTDKRAEQYILAGKCPVCMLLLTSEYHRDCPYLEEIVDKNKETIV